MKPVAWRHVVPILFLSLMLNLWGIHWGLPKFWQHDELTPVALKMLSARSFNHDNFAYGPLHYYTLMAFAVVPAVLTARVLGSLDLAPPRSAIMTILARTLSAVLATATVYLTYLVATLLFSHSVGLWSSFFLALTMGFVNIAHFATTDIPSLFWFMLSCTMSAHLLTDKSSKWYLLAGLFAGLCAAVKWVGGIAIIPLVFAHFLGMPRSHGKLALGLFTSLLGFALGNPLILLVPLYFVDGFLRELAFNAARTTDGPPLQWPLISNLLAALGVPLFALLLGGVLYSVKLALEARSRPRVLFLWSIVAPYSVVLASMVYLPMRYTVAVVPALLILAGKLMDDLLRHPSTRVRLASIVALAITAGYSAAYVVAADLAFVNDSRVLAAQWVARHIPEGTRIEMTPFAPNLSTDAYVVVDRPSGLAKGHPWQEASSEQRYETLLARSETIVKAIESATTKDAAERVRYRTFHEKTLERYTAASSVFDMSLTGLESRQPDIFIASSQYIDRFHNDHDGVEARLYRALFAGHTDYVRVAEFKYRLVPWLDPKVEFVNPTISIFRRHGQTRSQNLERP